MRKVQYVRILYSTVDKCHLETFFLETSSKLGQIFGTIKIDFCTVLKRQEKG